jgi:GNAT superfamily N-acetyltransferase
LATAAGHLHWRYVDRKQNKMSSSDDTVITRAEPNHGGRPDFDCLAIPKHQFIATDSPVPGTFQTLVQLLDGSSRSLIGPAQPRLLVIPISGDNGMLAGGFWGATMFEWLHVGLLFVPESLRGQGVGSALMSTAEDEARKRGCRGAFVDTFSFQAVPFYEKLGYAPFGTLEDYPPGHSQIYFSKRLEPGG